MKKTLTMLACAAVSMAAHADMTALTFGDGHAELVSSVSPSILESGRQSITFDAAKVHGNALSDYILTFQFTAIPTGQQDAFLRMTDGYNSTNNQGNLGVRTVNATTMNIVKGSGGDNLLTTGLTINTSDTFALTVSASRSVIILSNLVTGDTQELSTDAIPGSVTLTSGTAMVLSNSGNNKLTMGQIANLEGMTLAQVRTAAKTGLITPEPATATLSLLALAGLASRRRRH